MHVKQHVLLLKDAMWLLDCESVTDGVQGGVAKGSYEPLYKATQDPAKVEFLRTMRKKEFRKHLRKLKTQAEKEEAKAQRAKQAAQKAEILREAVKQQKDTKKAARKAAVEKLYAEGTCCKLYNVSCILFLLLMQDVACWGSSSSSAL